jgi:phosphoribosylanthranilate isomerase
MCGLTCAADVALACDAGADAVGVIVADSPRRVALERIAEIAYAVPPFMAKIGVVADPQPEEVAELRRHGFLLQFSGNESAEACEELSRGAGYVKTFHIDGDSGRADLAQLESYRHATPMFDTRVAGKAGGTGVPFPWRIVESVAKRRPVVVSGGLTAANVGACVRSLRPYAVDVRSGIETGGRKDVVKMRDFVRAVREADAET